MHSAFAQQRLLTVAPAPRAGVESIAWTLWNGGADLSRSADSGVPGNSSGSNCSEQVPAPVPAVTLNRPSTGE